MILLYVTCKDKEEALNISNALLDKKLIACANFFGITSIYRWEGKVEQGDEVVLLLKTVDDKFNSVKAEIENIHSYSTPCIMRLSAEANKAFSDWVVSEVRQ